MSTMDEARSRLRDYRAGLEELPQGAGRFDVVLARRQSGGRGRQGKSWQSSDPGGLYLTISDTVPRRVADLSGLPLVIGLAVHDMLASFRVASLLKWPNDVLTFPPALKKLSGILVETLSYTKPESQNADDGEHVSYAYPMIGIGLNVNQLYFSTEIPASSMALETGAPHPQSEVFERMLDRIVLRYNQFLKQGFRAIKDEYCSASALQYCDVLLDGTPVEVLGFTHEGALSIRVGGASQEVWAGEVSVLPKRT